MFSRNYFSYQDMLQHSRPGNTPQECSLDKTLRDQIRCLHIRPRRMGTIRMPVSWLWWTDWSRDRRVFSHNSHDLFHSPSLLNAVLSCARPCREAMIVFFDYD